MYCDVPYVSQGDLEGGRVLMIYAPLQITQIAE